MFQYIKSEYVEEDKIVYEYTYDNNNNLTNVKYSDRDEGLQTKDLVTYTYDNMDNLIKETRGNITTDYTYNMAGLVTEMTNKKGSSVISAYSNTYNYDGNVAKAVENGNTTTYTYDYMNRLKSEDSINAKYEYEYDAAGNRIYLECNDKNYEDYGTEYTYDKNNRLLEEVKYIYSGDTKYITDYHYDKNGNVLTKAKSHADTTSLKRNQSLGIKTGSELSENQMSEYFTYNVFNQLKSYRNTKGTTASYEYLPNNYRYSKTVGSTTTRFLWDGDYVAGELDATGNISKKYFYGMDMLSDDSGNNYIYDIHGSVTNVLNSRDTETKEYEYNAFGKIENETNQSTSNPWQYCGEYKDNETGLIYLRNRYYDPETGRFINEDPIRSGGNWYSYCDGNPIMFFDLSGLKGVQVSYVASKNGGSAKASYNNQGYTSSVTVSINGTTETYTVASGDVQIRHGRAIIDNEILMNDFGLSEDESLHLEGDVFNNVDDAALAFGLMYYDTAMEEQQEYGAPIDRVTGGYTFDRVLCSKDKVPAAFSPDELELAQRNQVEIDRRENTVATVHIHWDPKGSLNFSESDYANEESQVVSMFLVNRNFEFVKSIRYTGPDNIYGFSEGIVVF